MIDKNEHCLCDSCYSDDCVGTQEEREKSIRNEAIDDIISLINKNTFELDGKRLKISVSLLLKEIDSLRSK
jgi:hypothetical protein